MKNCLIKIYRIFSYILTTLVVFSIMLNIGTLLFGDNAFYMQNKVYFATGMLIVSIVFVVKCYRPYY